MSQSSFDIQIAYIQEIINSASYESHKMDNDIKRAKEELQQLKTTIENKNQSCIRQLQPRISQLQEKIEFYWQGVKKMDDVAWKDLDGEQKILQECQEFVTSLQKRTDQIHNKI